MCGLAGYNIAPAIADKHWQGIDADEFQKNIVRKAWLHNLHRGTDAAGFMGHTVDHKTVTWKAPGTAIDLLMNEIDKDTTKVPPMLVFGAHTRSLTNGPASDNRNNHPVSYNDWHVTHNGKISNHTILRNKFIPQQERQSWPEVDSAVIPLVLDKELSSIYDTVGVKRALGTIHGAFSIHAISSRYPGVSLFARGTDRPLIVAYHRAGIFAYGSEPESVWSVVNAMNVNPNKGFDWFELDQNHFFIVEQGEIIEWGDFKSNWVDSSSRAAQTVRRWLPREKNRQRTLVYEDDAAAAWVNKENVRSLKGNEEIGKLAYTREKGVESTVVKLPFKSETAEFSPIGEADVVYKVNEFNHAFFGDVEVILGPGRVVKDVLNHALPFTVGQRFEVVKEKAKPQVNGRSPASDMLLKDFLRLKTSDIQTKAIPLKDEPYAYIEFQRQAEKERKRKEREAKRNPKVLVPAKPDSGTSSTATTTRNTSGADEVDFEDDETYTPEMIRPSKLVTSDNVYEMLHPHKWADMFFVDDRVCAIHNQAFIQHSKPEECKVTMYAAAWAMASCSSIVLYAATVPGPFDLDYATDDKWCQLQQGKKCKWIKAEVIKVTNTQTSWFVTSAEMCSECSAYRALKNLPEWFENIPTGPSLSIIPSLENV